MSRGPVVLAAMLAATVAAGVIVSPGRAPEAGRETTLWLAVESRALDGDSRLADADRARFRSRFGADPAGVLVVGRDGEKRFDTPALWTAAAVTARRLVGPRGPHLLQGLLFALAAAAALATVRPRLGPGGGALLVAVALWGSAALLVPFRLEPHALELAAAAVAAAAVWRRGFGRATRPADVYQGEVTGAPGRLRWLLAGVAAGVLVAGSVAYLPLLWPLIAAAPARRRSSAIALTLAAAAATLIATIVISGPTWPALEPVLDLRLALWSSIGALVGRGVGLLPFYLPAALLVATAGRDEGRRFVLPAVALALAAQLGLAPFDWAESAAGPGNAWFLAPLALLIGAASHGESRRWTLAIGVTSLPFLAAPVWLESLGAAPLAARVGRWSAPLTGWLPEPTGLRTAWGSAELRRAGVVVRGVEPAVFAAGDDRLRLFGRRAHLTVIGDRPLSSVRLELGARAPVQTEVRGGRPGNTILRPNGELAIDVVLDPAQARRHPVWWSREGAWIHVLEIRLPAAPAAPVALDVPFARSLLPQEGDRP